jgi:hypothetical protein
MPTDCHDIDCPEGCDAALPDVDFDLCNPEFHFGEISDLFITNLGHPLTDETDATEWTTRLNLTSIDPARIVRLYGIGEKPAAESNDTEASYGRKAYGTKEHTVNFTIDEISPLNYELLRKLECNKVVLVWYKTTDGQLFGGASGIKVSLNFDHIIPEDASQLQTLVASITWRSKFHPCMTTWPEAIDDSGADSGSGGGSGPVDEFIVATGGTESTDGDFKVHVFTDDADFEVLSAPPGALVQYLMVAGGGAGGGATMAGAAGGGGGGGGVLTGTKNVFATLYPIVVGDGGISGSGTGKGGDSTFGGFTAEGGGSGAYSNGGSSTDGGDGGSGGGNTAALLPGIGTLGQGNNGGTAIPSGSLRASGGGGAAAPGQAGQNAGSGGNGGDGVLSTITGSAVHYAGGGGGGVETLVAVPGSGGNGGGGAGSEMANGTNGTPNTGGGGGGSASGFPGANQSTGGSGGKGIVIIRYQFQ